MKELILTFIFIFCAAGCCKETSSSKSSENLESEPFNIETEDGKPINFYE